MALDPKQASSAIERVHELTLQLQDTPLSQFSQQDVEAVVAAVVDDSGEPKELITLLVGNMHACLKLQLAQLLLRIWQVCTSTDAFKAKYSVVVQGVLAPLSGNILNAMEWTFTLQGDAIVRDGKLCMADTLDAAIRLVAAVSCNPDTISGDKYITTLWRLALCPPVLQGELILS
eukprot:18959-Heterococcus_DN1.PRE.2